MIRRKCSRQQQVGGADEGCPARKDTGYHHSVGSSPHATSPSYAPWTSILERAAAVRPLLIEHRTDIPGYRRPGYANATQTKMMQGERALEGCRAKQLFHNSDFEKMRGLPSNSAFSIFGQKRRFAFCLRCRCRHVGHALPCPCFSAVILLSKDGFISLSLPTSKR